MWDFIFVPPRALRQKQDVLQNCRPPIHDRWGKGSFALRRTSNRRAMTFVNFCKLARPDEPTLAIGPIGSS